MKHLAVFYTHNNLSVRILRESLKYFSGMVNYPSLLYDTQGIIVSAFPVLDLVANRSNKITNIISSAEILHKGHLSIIEKISLALRIYPSDFVSLHEHDMLYPPEYLDTVQHVLHDFLGDFDYVAYNNLLGANKTGYQRRMVWDYPLSTLTFPFNVLKELLENKRKEYLINKSWCYLEPGYGGSYGSHLCKLQLGKGSVRPAVHINMDKTAHNHHFTTHYRTYEPTSRAGFNEWPGDLSYIFE